MNTIPQTVFDELETLSMCMHEQGFKNAVVTRDEDGYYVIKNDEAAVAYRVFADYKSALKYATSL